MKLTRLAIAASLLMTGGAAAAQSATDAGCLLVSNAFAQNAKDANAQKAAMAASYFYLGRIGPQATAAQLRALFESQAKTITETTAGNMMNACVDEIQAKTKLVESLSPPAPPAQQKPKPQGR